MKTIIEIQNLKCGGCAGTIKTKVSAIKNVNDVLVDIENSTVSFYSESEEQISVVKQKLMDIGYPAIDEKNGLLTKAKSYASCAIGKIQNN